MPITITENKDIVRLGKEASKETNLIVLVPNRQKSKSVKKAIPRKVIKK